MSNKTDKSSVFPKTEAILCFYKNATSKIQVIRLNSMQNILWKRVIFPGQRLIFEAPDAAKLEVFIKSSVDTIRSNVILCQHIRLTEK